MRGDDVANGPRYMREHPRFGLNSGVNMIARSIRSRSQRPRWRRPAPRLAVFAFLLISLALALSGCSNVHLVIAIGAPASQPALTDAGQPAAAPPVVRPTPTQQPQATPTPQASPLPAVQPVARVPAQTEPTRIVAPSIHLDAPVVTVGWSTRQKGGAWFAEWETASGAAGFHAGSALPGHVGNTVISGHHNIEGKVFARLIELNPGDMIILYADDRPYSYQVVDRFVLKEAGAPEEQRRQNALWIAPTRDERLTLVTCWPPNGNTHRVIVIAKPISVELAQSHSHDEP